MQSILTVLVTLVLLPDCLSASNGDDCHTLREASFLSHLPNAFIPRCEKDGTYSAVQCHANNCFCVRKDGTRIEETDTNRRKRKHMNCKCARDKTEHKEGFHERMDLKDERIFLCESNGNYAKVQCIGSTCFCVDINGKQIGNHIVHISKTGSIKC